MLELFLETSVKWQSVPLTRLESPSDREISTCDGNQQVSLLPHLLRSLRHVFLPVTFPPQHTTYPHREHVRNTHLQPILSVVFLLHRIIFLVVYILGYVTPFKHMKSSDPGPLY